MPGKEHLPSSISWGKAGKLPSLPDTLLCSYSSLYSASEKSKYKFKYKTQAESQNLL